jgi:folate-binding protein YgfZ
MNLDWKNALLTHLAVITVGGNDAAKLLQGQITCNINDISDSQSSWGAICNAKGRAIATFLLVKQAADFHLIVPAELLDTVKKRLTMFVLRSAVTITDSSQKLCLMGVASSTASAAGLATRQSPVLRVQLGGRDFILASVDEAKQLCAQPDFQPIAVGDWILRDMAAGIAWLTRETSEAFVPQMLNLDKLGGISFTKGCYTGQEIIARTHYLGKSKRGMLLAAAATPITPAPYAEVLDAGGETVGHVLMAQSDGQNCTLLMVVQLAENNAYQLKLADLCPLVILAFNSAVS